MVTLSASKSRALVPVETTPTELLHPPMLTACPASIPCPLALLSLCLGAFVCLEPHSSTASVSPPSQVFSAAGSDRRHQILPAIWPTKAAAQGSVRPLLPELLANLPPSTECAVRSPESTSWLPLLRRLWKRVSNQCPLNHCPPVTAGAVLMMQHLRSRSTLVQSTSSQDLAETGP